MSLNQDTTLLHYRLIDKLGEGGMGVVWTATDTTLDREVAIKVLPEALAEHSDRLARFEGDFVQYRWQRQYDVHPDGKHFVMVEDPPGSHLEVVLNWFTELDRTVARND